MGSGWAVGEPPALVLIFRSSSPTMRCLYSSEASCTAVSHALGPLAYTRAGSNFQYLRGEGVLGTGSAPPVFPDARSAQGPELVAETAGVSQVQERESHVHVHVTV